MTFSQEVQHFFQRNYVAPARQRGQGTVEVKAGEIHSKLGWTRRVPVVCAALSSQKLQRNVGVRLTGKSGPPSGQSPTVVYRFEILSSADMQSVADNQQASGKGLMGMYGIAAELYREVGGGEAFLRAARENFGSIVPDDENEAGKDSR
jgi:hypothetical protein